MRSPALNNLQELKIYGGECLDGQTPPQIPVFRYFSPTVRVLTISRCYLPDDTVGVVNIHFPQLRQLSLENVVISEELLNSIIAASPVLEFLLLGFTSDFHCVRIDSPSLISIAVRKFSGELVIENAPLLQRLLQLEQSPDLHLSVVAAPKLEALGCLSGCDHHLNLAFGATVVQDLLGNLGSRVRILAVDTHNLCLDMVIDLVRCFPCLEKLYIQSLMPANKKLWHHKDHHLIRSLDIRIKTVVLKNYQGRPSHIVFARFFVAKAKMLESMIFQGKPCCDEKFIAKQHRMLKVEERASRGAKFYFTAHKCLLNLTHVKNVHDLSITDPFDCSCRNCF